LSSQRGDVPHGRAIFGCCEPANFSARPVVATRARQVKDEEMRAFCDERARSGKKSAKKF
jgi:hypothetical protein